MYENIVTKQPYNRYGNNCLNSMYGFITDENPCECFHDPQNFKAKCGFVFIFKGI